WRTFGQHFLPASNGWRKSLGKPNRLYFHDYYEVMLYRTCGQIAQFILLHLLVHREYPDTPELFGLEKETIDSHTQDIATFTLKIGSFLWLFLHLRSSYNEICAEEQLVLRQYQNPGVPDMIDEARNKHEGRRIFLHFPLACLFFWLVNWCFLVVFDYSYLCQIFPKYSSEIVVNTTCVLLIGFIEAGLAWFILDIVPYEQKESSRLATLLEVVRDRFELQSTGEAMAFIEEQIKDGELEELEFYEDQVDDLVEMENRDRTLSGASLHKFAKMAMEAALVKKVAVSSGYVGLLRKNLELGTIVDDEIFDSIESSLDLLREDSQQVLDIMGMIRQGDWEFVAPSTEIIESKSDVSEQIETKQEEETPEPTDTSEPSINSTDEDLSVLRES
ncbi:hypothetical protein PFISCL1PPCAC_9783, partial [Pristionchus fissidentatus]